jgi:hypothetical protein
LDISGEHLSNCSQAATWRLVASTLLLCLCASTGCARGDGGDNADPTKRPTLSTSKAEYPTVSALGDAAETIVLGRVSGVIAKEEDNGGRAGNPSLPVVLYSFSVTRVVEGNEIASEIPILWSDTDLVDMDGVSPLDGSGEMLLFLKHKVSAVDAPGIDSVDEFYVPLSSDNGVFDVARSGTTGTARSDTVLSLDGSHGTTHSGDRTWPLPAILRAASRG